MTDTTLTPASQNMESNGRAASPVHKLRSAELSRVWNERVEKIRRMREEYESLRQRRLRQLLDAERAAQELRDKLLEQRRHRLEEVKRKEDERRNAAEERRRQQEAEEKSKLEENLRRTADRESRFDSIKRRAGKGEKYAFGSSLPRDFGSVFGAVSASASASRAESDYEDNVVNMSVSTKTSRSASPRHEKDRGASKRERRAVSIGANGRRTTESIGLSLAPESGVETPRLAGRMRSTKAAGGSNIMSTSMLVEYHSSLMPVSGDFDEANLSTRSMTASQHRIDADYTSSTVLRRTLAQAGVTASSSRNLTPLDRGASPLRVHTRVPRISPSPARAALRTDEQLVVSVPIDVTHPDSPGTLQSNRLLVVKSARPVTNGDASTSENDSTPSPYSTRLRKPLANQMRAASPRKTASSRTQLQSTSPSRIPLSVRSARSAKLERSHSAGASDALPDRRTRNAPAAALSTSMTGSMQRSQDTTRAVPQSSIPKPIRPRSADPERRNRLQNEDSASAQTQAPTTTPTPAAGSSSTNYAEWKAKIDAANSTVKDSISTPKRSISPTKLPQSLRGKTPTPTTASGSSEEPALPPPIRGGVKSPLKVANATSAGASLSPSPAAIVSITKAPSVTLSSVADVSTTVSSASDAGASASVPPKPAAAIVPTPKPNISVSSEPAASNAAPVSTNGLLSNVAAKPTIELNGTQNTSAGVITPVQSDATNIPTQPPILKQSAPAVPPQAQPTDAAANPNASAGAGGNWLQFEQVMLAKRSEQLEEEWQKLKSEEERKQRDLADRERALKAREAQLADLEKERLARKERLKNIMTRVRPGPDELDVSADGNSNRAQSMSMLADLRSQQLGLFGASAAGPSTSSVLDAALQRESARSSTNTASAGDSSCAEVEFAGAWAPSRRVMFAQAPLVLGGGTQPSAPVAIQRSAHAHNPAVLSSILRSSRLAQPGSAELSSSAPPGVGGLAALGGISSLMQLRRQVEAAATAAAAAAATNGPRSQPAPPTGP